MSFGDLQRNISSLPPREEFRIFFNDQDAVSNLAKMLKKFLREQDPLGTCRVVLLCIGTDRSTGDSLGPLVGSRVVQLAPNLFPVYGNLDDPVHAVNLKEKLQQINKSYSFPLIIAVDACLGQLQSVGSIILGRGPLYPGTGVHKKLPPVGEIYISGVVNIGGYLEHLVLQNTRLSIVIKMAECIAQGLVAALGNGSDWEKQIPGSIDSGTLLV